MICIDDFRHRADPDEEGRFFMQDAIREFARDRGFEIESKSQSRVLHR